MTYNGLGQATRYDERRCHEGLPCHDISISNILRDTTGTTKSFTATIDGVAHTYVR